MIGKNTINIEYKNEIYTFMCSKYSNIPIIYKNRTSLQFENPS